MNRIIELSDLLLYTRGLKWGFQHVTKAQFAHTNALRMLDLQNHLFGTSAVNSSEQYFSCSLTQADRPVRQAHGVMFASGLKDEFGRPIGIYMIYFSKSSDKMPDGWGRAVFEYLRPQYERYFNSSYEEVNKTLPFVDNRSVEIAGDIPKEVKSKSPFVFGDVQKKDGEAQNNPILPDTGPEYAFVGIIAIVALLALFVALLALFVWWLFNR